MKIFTTSGSSAAQARFLSNAFGSSYYSVLALASSIRDIYYEVPGRAFDAWHGVDTGRAVGVPDLSIPEHLWPEARKYQPTKLPVFSHVVRRLPVGDRGKFAFVDFGSGKGRCLLLAARAGFGRVIGVELSRPLCEAARANAAKFISGRKFANVEVQCSDAAAVVLPRRPSVYFFYNPFGERTMARTMRLIDRHLTKAAHEAFIVYVNPVHAGTVAEAGFRLLERGTRQTEHWSIWHRPRNRTAVAA